MGVMESVRATEEAGRLVITPSPVLLDGQKNVAADLIPGESLYSFLSRHVDPSEPWEVRIGGVVVPVELWDRIKPKDGHIIEVRGAVNRQAVALVAMVALTYFTFGAGAAAGGIFGTATGAGTFFGASGLAASMLATGTMIAGSVLINKVLTPKPPRART